MFVAKDHARVAERLARLDGGARPLLAPDYHFLNGFVDRLTLDQASLIAADWGVLPHDVLIASGRLQPDDYYRALAQYCGIAFKPKLAPEEAAPPARMTPRQCLIHGLLKDRTRDKAYIFAAEGLRPNDLRAMLAQLKPHTLSLAVPQTMRAAICRHFAASLVHDAVEGLAERDPEASARYPAAMWQTLALILGAIAALYSFFAAPAETVKVLTLALALLFVPVIALRLVAVVNLMRSSEADSGEAGARVPDRELSVYTILAPLYREAHMLPGLVNALARLDWPAAKLDIKLILESVDTETIAAAQALQLPGNFEIVVVPAHEPRTKPKALNYALPLARGEYLVIYDAEDRPEPDQLRRALPRSNQGRRTSPRCRRASTSTTCTTIG